MKNSESKIDQMSTHAIAMRLLDLAAGGGRRYEFQTEKGVVGVTNMADYPGDEFIYIGFEDIADNWLLIVHVSGDTDNDIRRGPNETAVPEHEYKAFMRAEMLRVLGELSALALPKLTWEQTFKADPWDGVSACATYMGLDFHVELQDDGRFEMSAMLHGALYSFGKIAIRQRAIDKMEKIFNEMLLQPIDVMRVAERYAKD